VTAAEPAARVRHLAKNLRVDLELIAGMIAPKTRVLDIGCGEGTLIAHLFHTKACDARGIEIDMREVTQAVAHGLPVMQGNADSDLAHYPDGAFDYVVLSRTLQAVGRPREVLRQMLRIGARAVTPGKPEAKATQGEGMRGLGGQLAQERQREGGKQAGHRAIFAAKMPDGKARPLSFADRRAKSRRCGRNPISKPAAARPSIGCF
jgi:SAM-dependent methyltransferase